MTSPLTILYAIGLPVLGTVVAVTVTVRAWIRTKAGAEPSFARSRGMVLVFTTLPVTLSLFGFSLLVLLNGASDSTAASLLEAAALAYGAPALIVGVGEAVVLQRSVSALSRDTGSFGRSNVIAVLPEVGALFAYTIAFLILGHGRGHIADAGPLVAAGMQAAAWAVLCGVSSALGAVIASSVKEFHTLDGWRKGLLRGMPSQALTTVFFALAFLSLSSA